MPRNEHCACLFNGKFGGAIKLEEGGETYQIYVFGLPALTDRNARTRRPLATPCRGSTILHPLAPPFLPPTTPFHPAFLYLVYPLSLPPSFNFSRSLSPSLSLCSSLCKRSLEHSSLSLSLCFHVFVFTVLVQCNPNGDIYS